MPQRERVVVTVRRDGEDVADGRDLELPASMPAGELSRLVQAALGWPVQGGLHIRVEPGGHVLGQHESLAKAGVWDGAWLVFTGEAVPIEAPAENEEADHWPSLLPAKRPPAERPRVALFVAAAAAVAIGAAIGVWVLRPQPSPPVAAPRPTPVPQAPTPMLVATPVPEPTMPPTPLPTLQPTAPPTPRPTTAPTVAPTLVPDPASILLAELDPIWGRDWPRAITLAQGFLQRFPGHPVATDKLYVSLLEYGRQLKNSGQLDAARTAFQDASDVQPDRPEAAAEIDALAPRQVVQPPSAPPAAQGLARPQVSQAPAQPAAAAPNEPEAPPAKLTVTRDSYVPPEPDR